MSASRIRLLLHDVIPRCGSFEVRFKDGRPSHFFYWDDVASGRLRPETLDGETALAQAKVYAQAERDKGGA